ncbi:PP0621 family protein [Nitrosophilus kaiyonis]|uniref:PP0621 family protein n=1 Tax=Nitrosophilus kaiyonis TaxID=2930200 RepID=UPI0024907152|nr:PP0621 family protein [Nitrosophilus kaiyonis]
MLFKIIILIALIAGVYYFFIKSKPIEYKTKKEKSKKDSEDIMVECEKCKTYVSSKEAIIKNGKYYCSKECAGVN